MQTNLAKLVTLARLTVSLFVSLTGISMVVWMGRTHKPKTALRIVSGIVIGFCGVITNSDIKVMA